MNTKLQYGTPMEAYHRGTNYIAWKFPGDVDDTAPDWIKRELENNKLSRQDDGTWKFKKVTVNEGDVFMYHSIRMEVTVSDSSIFEAHFFVVNEDETSKEVEETVNAEEQVQEDTAGIVSETEEEVVSE